MYGFTIIKGANIDKEKLPLYKQSIELKLQDKDQLFFGYNSFSKFNEDKIFKENTKYVIGLDGVVLNLQKLKNTYGISNYFDLITTLYFKFNINFVAELKGDFNGFLFNKETQQLYFFNNKTGTKQAFYTTFHGFTMISYSIEQIVLFKESIGLSNRLAIQSVYDMLTFGTVMANKTLVKDIFCLRAGKYLELTKSSFIEKEYFSYNTIDYTIHSKKEAINKIDKTIIEAVKMQYEKDIAYHYPHLALLSGGLDSRVNVMLADKLGYKNSILCFSNPNYLDEIISRKIAKRLNLDYQFISLKDGGYMKNLQQNVFINNGMRVFTSSAHYNYALQKKDISLYGLVHSGQIGDGVFGGLLSKTNKENFLSKVVSTKFLNKTSITQAYQKKYKNEEIFKLYNYVFNLTHSGSYTTEFYKSYLVSPFLDDDVMAVAFSIDPKLRYNQNIYIDWILNKHPEISKFVWERTGFKPNKKWKTIVGRYTNKIKKEYFYVLNKKEKLSMTPEDFWLETNNELQTFYNHFFEKHILLLQKNKEVFTDLKNYYTYGDSTEKSIVLTILQIILNFKLKI
ncbi:asparagine synthase-related protein [Tenacibaculum sp. UWU-22]|uniref:asparagine synthase-related protein n=1 Tax=Tenacibaculum sp. UWU-22 TaxID=3234187 RepID=UPI0034DB1FC2